MINATTPVTATFSTMLQRNRDAAPRPDLDGVPERRHRDDGFSMVQEAGFGFRYLVSSGNEAVVDFADYLYAFAWDPGTRIIGGYLEGHRRWPEIRPRPRGGERRGKPVVLIKAGRPGATARAAQAHTGALVGEDRVVDAVLQEMGVMRVSRSRRSSTSCCSLPATRRAATEPGVGLITFGGGNGVLGADQCAQHGLTTPSLGAECVERLRSLLISVATAANPLDLTPTTAFRPEALAKLPAGDRRRRRRSPHIGSLLFSSGSMAARANEISDVICGLCRARGKAGLRELALAAEGASRRLAR